MFVDETRCVVWEQIRRHDLRAFDHLLTPAALAAAAQHAGRPLGRSALNLAHLVWLGLAAALHPARPFAEVLTATLRLLHDAQVWPEPQAAHGANASAGRRKHHPGGHEPTVVTEEAFVKARRHMPMAYWTALILLLADRFEAEHDAATRWKQFRLLALDGTSVDLPNWPANAAHFGTPANGKASGVPQARMVMLQLPLVRLPWRYELTTLAEGERTVATRLLRDLRPADLVLMDQGFWSYGLFWQIQGRSACFAIRLYPGVRLETIQRWGPEDRLVRWTPSDRRWRQQGLPEAITLRVITYQIPGFRPSAVVTNVLDPAAITPQEWVRLATAETGRTLCGLYHRRWEIESTFRELKVAQGLDGGLRSRTPAGIAYEVAGHVVLYLLVRWLIVDAAQERGLDPLSLSFIGALRELAAMETLLITSEATRVAGVLLPRLRQRIAEHRVAYRPGRHYPRPHDRKILNKGKGKRRVPNKLQAIPSQG